jgi:hypothetical protein
MSFGTILVTKIYQNNKNETFNYLG